ncbi:MAG TPA: hypothetical protein VH255_03610 [Verrucomicrobiae bacterium]|nr:hypothetical protein [Verrucomicrobiae bacterium]
MKTKPIILVTLIGAVFALGALHAPAGARPAFSDLQPVGLYDSDSATITTGELNSQDYWWTKYDAMMLEIALKQHQPEGRIGIDLAIALRRIDDLLKKYPKHEEILKWKAHFEEVQSKIDPNADRGASFTTECPWDESNFAQLWVNVHFLKFLVDQKAWNDAEPLVSNIRQNYEIMLAPDRMKNYPEDLQKWVTDSRPEFDKLAATVKSKTNG